MNKTIDELRQQIDAIDKELIELLAKRKEVSKKIGEIKKELQIDVFDEKRWEDIVKKVQQKAEELHLDKDFVKKIFETIHEHSKKIQQ